MFFPEVSRNRVDIYVNIVSLAVVAVAALHRLQALAVAAEIEPFKTAISLRMDRAWPFVVYALVLFAAVLFVERAFCRFHCPIGAVQVIGGKLADAVPTRTAEGKALSTRIAHAAFIHLTIRCASS